VAIADYSTLVASIKSWCARSDSTFSAQIPTFIGIGEERIYDGAGEPGQPDYSPPLRTKAMEATGTVTLTDGAGTLPSDALAVRKIYRPGDAAGITYVTPERWAAISQGTGSGVPVYYTVEGSTIKVVPSSSGETLNLLYCKRWPAITTGNPTGPVLAAHGYIYLEAALFEAFSWMQEVELALGHAARCRSMVQGANKTAGAMRYPGPLRVRHRVPIP